jgi:hypothetical protein
MVEFVHRGWNPLKSLIQCYFGIAYVHLVNTLQREFRKIAHPKNDISFLRRCKTQNIIPKFLKPTKTPGTNSKIDSILRTCEQKLLNEFINDSYRKLKRIERHIYKLRKDLADRLPFSLFKTAMEYLAKYYDSIFQK